MRFSTSIFSLSIDAERASRRRACSSSETMPFLCLNFCSELPESSSFDWYRANWFSIKAVSASLKTSRCFSLKASTMRLTASAASWGFWCLKEISITLEFFTSCTVRLREKFKAAASSLSFWSGMSRSSG